MIKTKKEIQNVTQSVDFIKQRLERQRIQVGQLEHKIECLNWQFHGLKRQVSRHRQHVKKVERQLGLVSD